MECETQFFITFFNVFANPKNHSSLLPLPLVWKPAINNLKHIKNLTSKIKRTASITASCDVTIQEKANFQVRVKHLATDGTQPDKAPSFPSTYRPVSFVLSYSLNSVSYDVISGQATKGVTTGMSQPCSWTRFTVERVTDHSCLLYPDSSYQLQDFFW